MTGWQWQRMGVFDLETTAPDPEEARIVTACLGSVGGDLGPVISQTLVNPGVEIPQGAIDIHGVTNERARADGLDPIQVVDDLCTDIEDMWAQGMPVVAFNAAYDLTVLDRERRRHLGCPLEISGPVIDPFVIDRQVDKYRKGKRTLTAQTEHYRVALNGAHDAIQDALAAGRLAWKLAQSFPQIAAMSLQELHAAQAVWHAERQADFANYLRKQGKPADDVCGDWPLRPFGALVGGSR